MSERFKTAGNLSALGTFLLIALIAWQTKAFPTVTSELLLLLTGDYQQVAANHTTFLMMFPVILAVVTISLPCTIAAALLQATVLGKHGKHAIREMLDSMGQGNHFLVFFGAVLVEELLARWFFLGVLTKIPALSGTAQFYILFFVGNLIWALHHLDNFKETKDRHVLRVLPQFVSGAFFTYVFVKYGLLATILAHFASNAVLFATHKLCRFTVFDGIIAVYSALCAAISFYLMDKPFADILPWFDKSPTFALEGWEFGDYLILSTFFSAVISLAFSLLLYDQKQAEEDGSETSLVAHILGIPLALGILYGIFALLGLFMDDVPIRMLVIAIMFSFFNKCSSGSHISRTFWGALPDVYITVCIIQALGFWSAAGWLALSTLISLPVIMLRQMNS